MQSGTWYYPLLKTDPPPVSVLRQWHHRPVICPGRRPSSLPKSILLSLSGLSFLFCLHHWVEYTWPLPFSAQTQGRPYVNRPPCLPASSTENPSYTWRKEGLRACVLFPCKITLGWHDPGHVLSEWVPLHKPFPSRLPYLPLLSSPWAQGWYGLPGCWSRVPALSLLTPPRPAQPPL